MKKLFIVTFTVFASVQMHAGFWDSIRHSVSKAEHSVAAAGKAVAHGVQGMYDAVTAMSVPYTKVSGYPLGIQNMVIQLQFSKGSVKVPIVQNGDWVTYGSQGSTQALLAHLVGGGQSSLFNLATSSHFKTSDEELHFNMAYSGGQLHITTVEKISTTDQDSNSNDMDTTNQSRNIGAMGLALSDPAVKKLNPKMKKVPAGSPASYVVTVNGSRHNTKFGRAFYIDL